MSGPTDSDPDSGPRRDTHRGLGEVEASFTPSDSDELRPSFNPAFPNGLPEHEVRLPSSPKVPEIEDPGGLTTDAIDRRLFDTSMGGGANRVSGGREAARAYVAPRTPRPVLFHSQDTLSIEVAERNNQFDTVPSLSRRKLARLLGDSIPGLESRPPERGVNLWFVMGLALFGGIFLVFLANRESPDEKPGAPAESRAVAAKPGVESAPLAAAAPSPPAQPSEPVAVPSEAPEAPIQPNDQPAVSAAARPAPGPKPVKAPASKASPSKAKTSSSKTEDLWLE